MKNRSFLFFALGIVILTAACNSSQKDNSGQAYFLSPESGKVVKSGESVTLQIQFPERFFPDSVVYFIDEQRFASVKDTQSLNLPTAGLKMGNRLITARAYRAAEFKELSTNIIMKPAAAPVQFSYQIEAVLPHDTSSYTQGLVFNEGVFYESDGEYASSTVRKVDPKTGSILKKVDFPDDYFAEGLAVVGKRIILLTWRENMGFVLDKSTLQMIEDFPYQNSREGWGLCYDGSKLYKSDGSNLIYFLNPETYREEGSVEVYDHNGPVDQLNELEFIDGKIFANIYQSRRVVIINPATGAVTGELDLSGLSVSNPNADVLNGIAYDKSSGRIWVTGKKWNKLFQIRLEKK